MCVSVCVFRGWVGGGVGADIWPSLISPGAAEVRGRQPCVFFYDVLCWNGERPRTGGAKRKGEQYFCVVYVLVCILCRPNIL